MHWQRLKRLKIPHLTTSAHRKGRVVARETLFGSFLWCMFHVVTYMHWLSVAAYIHISTRARYDLHLLQAQAKAIKEVE